MKGIFIFISILYATLISNAQPPSFEWAKSIGGYYGMATGVDIAVDNLNNVYTTGTFEGRVDFDPGIGIYNLTSSSYGNRDIFICKHDSSGNFTWAKQIMGSNWYDYVSSIAVDGSGNVYAAGYFRDTSDFDPGPGIYYLTSNAQSAFILKLNGSGNFIWAKQFGGITGTVWLNSMTWIFQAIFILPEFFGVLMILIRVREHTIYRLQARMLLFPN